MTGVLIVNCPFCGETVCAAELIIHLEAAHPEEDVHLVRCPACGLTVHASDFAAHARMPHRAVAPVEEAPKPTFQVQIPTTSTNYETVWVRFKGRFKRK